MTHPRTSVLPPQRCMCTSALLGRLHDRVNRPLSRGRNVTKGHTDTTSIPVADPVSPAAARLAHRTVVWGGVLFALVLLLQRFAAPGTGAPLLLLVAMGWGVLALRAGVLEIDRRRFLFWSLTFCVTGAALLVQTALGTAPVISVNSWALLLIVWFPAVARFVDRQQATYRRFLVVVTWICTAFAAVCILQMAVQLAGVPYEDLLKPLVPEPLMMVGFNVTTPVEYGSSIYRSNGWIGLEASIASYQLGIGLVTAILARQPMWMIAVLVTGLFTTVAGSGFLLAGVALVAILVTRVRRQLVKPLIPILALGGVLVSTPYGQLLIARSGEAQEEGSSASQRAIQPYAELWPEWATDTRLAVLGGGAGSSQRVIDVHPMGGDLLVPLPGKIFYDYGLIAGLVLALFLVYCYLDGPSLTVAFTMFVSMWTVQPGSNIPVFILPLLLLVTFWAPRSDPRLEDVGRLRPTPEDVFRRLRSARPRRLERTLGP
jgi:hypothetical protein